MAEARVRANALLQEALGPALERIGGTLRDLGLSGNAAKVFCALVRTGRGTASELVLKTGIPDSKIYYALDELAEKGLVEVQDGKPKVYRVVTPKEVEIRLARIAEEDYERRRASTARLRSILEPLGVATASPATDIAYIVKGLPNVVSRARTDFLRSEGDRLARLGRVALPEARGRFGQGDEAPRASQARASGHPRREGTGKGRRGPLDRLRLHAPRGRRPAGPHGDPHIRRRSVRDHVDGRDPRPHGS